MRTASKWTRTLGIGAAVFLLFGVVGIAGAQRPEGAPTGRGDGPRGPQGDLRGEFVTHLAANLGLPEQTVRDALAKTRADMAPLLQERHHEMGERFYDRINRFRQGIEERFHGGNGPRPSAPGEFQRGMPPVSPSGRPSEPRGSPGMGPDLVGLSAAILNLTPEAIRLELEGGKTLAQIAQEHGIQPASLGDQLAARLEQQRLQGMRAGIERMLDQPFGRPGPPHP